MIRALLVAGVIVVLGGELFARRALVGAGLESVLIALNDPGPTGAAWMTLALGWFVLRPLAIVTGAAAVGAALVAGAGAVGRRLALTPSRAGSRWRRPPFGSAPRASRARARRGSGPSRRTARSAPPPPWS